MRSTIRRLLFAIPFSLSFIMLKAQPAAKSNNKPYKLLSSGKQVTIKSNKNIQLIMLWTSSGHRVVEQRDINATSYNFIIPVNEKIFFLMLGLEGGKIYTEKIGLQ